VGVALFAKAGRGLVLTDAGRSVMPYADEIFSLGAELAHNVRSGIDAQASSLTVGIVNSIAKLVAYRTLEPLLAGSDAPRLICYEADLEKLLADLSVHRLDLVLSDRPIPPGFSVKAYSHKLGESSISFYARGPLARRCSKNFPASLDGTPLLLPVPTSAIRRGLDDWFNRIGIAPRVVAEFDDSALMKAFGESGTAVFPAPDAIGKEVEHMYGARRIGGVPDLTESYYAISPERKLSNPAIVKLTELARTRLEATASK